MIKILLILGFLVCIFSLIISFVLIRRQKDKELDKGMNLTSVRHPVVANPIIIAYVLFPVTLILGGIIWMYYFY